MIIVIVTAGGSGKRMNSSTKKQFLQLSGKPILSWTIKRFSETDSVEHIILVLPPDEMKSNDDYTEGLGSIVKVGGGIERRDSVMNGLKKASEIFDANNVNKEQRFVLVHDGVRPLISVGLIERVIDSTKTHGSGVPLIPVSETLIKMTPGEKRALFPDRSNLYLVQTPQGFRLDVIIKAYEKSICDGIMPTDESSAVTADGGEVHSVEGERLNIKITTPSDYSLAEKVIPILYRSYFQ